MICNPVTDDDWDAHLLASLPESFNKLVMALEGSLETVPKTKTVAERLLYEE